METAPGTFESQRQDRGICALAMILCALALSLANNVDLYKHIGGAVCGLSIGIAACAAAVMLPSLRQWSFDQRGLALVIGPAVVIQAAMVQVQVHANVMAAMVIAIIALNEVWRFPSRRSGGMAALAAMALVFFASAAITIHRPANAWSDVLMSQQKACEFLSHGVNPYAAKYPNIYAANTPLYAPGMVDASNHLKFGFGYPPLSLLMVMPSYLLTGDIRYGLAAAVALSAILIGIAGRGRLGVLAAAAFLAGPQWPRMLAIGWVEPLLILNFSLVMFCACRWRPGLPWALGIFLATKQYAIFAVPLLPLLFDARANDGKWHKSLPKTAVMLLIMNVPFLVWNPVAFWNSLVMAHVMQSFRPDALSYTAWIYRHGGGWVLPMWAALVAVAAAWGEALRRGVRSPAGFAAGVTLALLVFFAFNKQAFLNYYSFLIASAWWAVAAARWPAVERIAVAGRAVTADSAASRSPVAYPC